MSNKTDTATEPELAEQLGFPKGTDVQRAIQSLVAPIEHVLVIGQAARGISISYSGPVDDLVLQAERTAMLLNAALARANQRIGELKAKKEAGNGGN